MIVSQGENPVRVDRPLDVTFLIDSIENGDIEIEGFDGTLDPGRLGVAGHSFGGYTAIALAGATVDVPAEFGGEEIAENAVAFFDTFLLGTDRASEIGTLSSVEGVVSERK